METTKAMCMHNNSRDLRKKQKQIKNKGVFSKWGKGHLQVCSFFSRVLVQYNLEFR